MTEISGDEHRGQKKYNMTRIIGEEHRGSEKGQDDRDQWR